MSKSGESEASPLGKSRYGRTRKPKISEDFCNIDDLFSDGGASRAQRSPQKSPAGKSKGGASPVAAKAVEIDSLFMPKQIQPLPKQVTPQKVQMDTLDVDLPKVLPVPLKERKFFKSNSEVSGGDSVDVTAEVLKIIKSDHPDPPPPETAKSAPKPMLRTYGNKRKQTTKAEVVVVESFALPDNPIVPATVEKTTETVIDIVLPEKKSTENKELPTNSIDIKENDVSDCTLKLNYNVVFDEMCIKADECMLKGTSVKKLHDENEAGKRKPPNDVEEKKELANGVKEKNRKKPAEKQREVSEKCVGAEVSKKSTVLNEESSKKTAEKPAEGGVTLKRKRGRPRKYNILPAAGSDLHERTTDSVAEESENNLSLSLTESTLKTVKKLKESDQTDEKTAKNTKSPLKPLPMVEKAKNVEEKPSPKRTYKTADRSLGLENVSASPEKQLRSGKIVNTEENTTKKAVDVSPEKSPVKKKRGRPSLDKQLKQEKLFEDVGKKTTSPQKSPRKPKPFRGDFLSPPRMLRSSVILVERPAEIVDLTGNDADGESSEEETLKKRGDSKKKVEKGDDEKSLDAEDGKKKKVDGEEKSVNKSLGEKVGGDKTKVGDGKMVGVHDDKERGEENEEVDCSKVKEEPKEKVLIVKLESCDKTPGQLMWGRIGNYPYWPCIITNEPESKLFKRDRIVGRLGKRVIFHVRFFGDKGRRAWVQANCLIPFNGENDLHALAKTASFANKSAYIVPPAKVQKWKTAVQEALSVQSKTIQERFDFFFNMFATKREKKQRLVGIAENVRRKHQHQQRSSSSRRESARKTPPLKAAELRRSSGRLRKVVKADVAASECSLSDTDTSSKFSVNSTNSLEAQAALYKRNNIFRGAYKGRVCEICEKQQQEEEEVFKCKECAGYFHGSCAQKGAAQVGGAKKEEEGDDGGSVGVEGAQEVGDGGEGGSKTADMKELPLQKQIDLRMKEIMKKFDYRSVYADSTSDSEQPEEDSGTEKAKESPKSDVPEKKIIQHVTADCITFAELENPDTKPPEHTTTTTTPIPTPTPPKTDELKHETASVSSTEDDAHPKKPTPNKKCFHCRTNSKPPCFVCNESTEGRRKCSLHSCGKVYHTECLKQWPQTRTPTTEAFVCPMHVCHTCVSDDPRGACARHPTDNLVRCVKCPSTYHSSSHCLPAGTVILSTKQVVCVRHVANTKFNKTVNTTWCFLCALGGDLVCCETCPTSVHAKCLKLDLSQTDKYICDDCESGRYPLYDEIVWVKLGKYRWWPAVVLFPNEVPERVNGMPHTQGEFVVRFYGTHDHHWVSRGRVFLFEEGDEEHMGRATKKMDLIFRRAVEEAIAAFQLKQSFKTAREAEMRSNLKPPAYVKIKNNRPVGNVRQFDGNTSNATACDCDPTEPFPCGPDSDCLNRLLLTECDPTVCPAAERCNNQRFEKRQYPPLVPYKTQGRGWGLKTMAPIKKGQFVIEYVGELIDDQEYQRRIQKMHEQKEENYYFLTIDKDRTIDAGPKGNMARFMNHSCQPNCETQKWTVDGDTRVGLFATDDIAAGAELTFNYNLECVGKEKKICRCGAPNCSGFIGVKAKNNNQEEVQKKPKRLLRKKKSPPPTEPIEPTVNFCFVCSQSGDVMGCHNKVCNNFYHLKCVALREWPDGKWVCPWHNCNICAKRTIRCCVKCLNSYCPAHSEGYIRHDRLLGFVCFEHDPTKESPVAEVVPSQPETSNTSLQTEETDITSTTLDDLNTAETKSPDPDSTKPEDLDTAAAATGDFKDLPSSTPLKKRRDSGADSDVPQTSAAVAEKKKRGRKKKKNRKMPHEVKVLPVRAAKNLLNSSLTMQNEVKLTSTVPTRHLRAAKRSSDGGCISEFEKFLKRQQLDFENNLPIRKRSRARCETTL